MTSAKIRLYKTIISGGKELNEKIKISRDQGLTFRQVIANDLGICMSFAGILNVRYLTNQNARGVSVVL